MSIHSFVKPLYTFSDILEAADGTLKDVYSVFSFAGQVAEYGVFLSRSVALERLGVAHLTTALTTWDLTGATLTRLRAQLLSDIGMYKNIPKTFSPT